MSKCPPHKRLISETPFNDRSLILVGIPPGYKGGFYKGNTGHYRPHPLFDWLHGNITSPWSVHDSGLIRDHCSIENDSSGRTVFVAFVDTKDAVHFRLANDDRTSTIDPAWGADIDNGEYRTLANTNVAVTRCGLVKKDGKVLDLGRCQSVCANIIGTGNGSVRASANEMAGLVWGTEALDFGKLCGRGW